MRIGEVRASGPKLAAFGSGRRFTILCQSTQSRGEGVKDRGNSGPTVSHRVDVDLPLVGRRNEGARRFFGSRILLGSQHQSEIIFDPGFHPAAVLSPIKAAIGGS